MITASELAALAGVRHGFFTRDGGVSEGLYGSLNIGLASNDEPANVAENRRRVAAALGVEAERLVMPNQVHSPDVAVVDAPWAEGEKPKADAVVTATPGLAIGVTTADCGPVLFADEKARVVGAAHAGWRGAVGGVLEATIEAMESLGAKRARIVAVLGPTISGPAYEVGTEFLDRFLAESPLNLRYFKRGEQQGRSLFDLPRYIVDRLTNVGVQGSSLGLCTYGDEARFFSYRRMTHRGEADYGRLASAIALNDETR
ncbi:MAG: peptidoglycan editing factor PgeF [Hyphomicrobiales bacterium]|nr:MAG: peptidoglycan editing factor PgeF [Hyphomicrobiales bacterium]